MSETFETFSQPMWWDTSESTFLEELEAGSTPCGSQDGQRSERCGPGVVRVSRSPQQASGKACQTSGTCGQSFSGLSASAVLQSSLESKLKGRLSTAGSTWFSMTWKRKATPAGRTYCQLAASALDTFGSGYGGLPTLLARDARTIKGNRRMPNSRGSDPLLMTIAKRGGANRWEVEPDVGRVVHGIRPGNPEVRAFGNAIVPQVAAVFIRAFMETLAEQAK